jgi:hypothetical protein
MDFPKKGFSAFFRLKVVEIKPGDAAGDLVIFRFPDGGATEYFKSGQLFTATFKPLADDDERKE